MTDLFYSIFCKKN